MKKMTAILLTLAMLLTLTGCGAGAAANKTEFTTIQEGKLIIALSPDFAPMEFVELTKEGQDRYVGFDVSLAKFIAEEMGLTLEIRAMSFEACQDAVATGKVDMSISGFTWTEEREAEFNLSNYYRPGDDGDTQVLITLAANAGRFDTAEELADARIGAQDTSLQATLTMEQLPESDLILFDDLGDAVKLLQKGDFDCIAVSKDHADAVLATNSDIILSGFDFVVDEKYTDNLILLRKGNDSLTQRVNEILSKAKPYYATWYADARATAGIDVSYDDEGNEIPETTRAEK